MTDLARLVLPSFVFACALNLGCGTDSIGVEVCRKIELARCEAAVQCGIIDDVPACQRFFRDHCLHGVATEEEPGNVAADRCVDAIQLAGKCAEEHGPDAKLTRCHRTFFEEADAEAICELVEEPERASQCAFLAEVKETQTQLDDQPDAGE